MPLLQIATEGWLSSAGTTFLLIVLAEFGDKSQLVCMTLATRHRGWPVALGAMVSFALLNLLAVLFGATVAAWLPPWVVTGAVALLFGFFGIMSLRNNSEEDEEVVEGKPGHGIFLTSFLLIFMAEFGDKTQIAVAGLGCTHEATAVWVGATLALATTSLLGVYAGRRFVTRVPLAWIHRISGFFFLLLATLAAARLYSLIS